MQVKPTVRPLAGVSAFTMNRAIGQARVMGFLAVQGRRLTHYRNDGPDQTRRRHL